MPHEKTMTAYYYYELSEPVKEKVLDQIRWDWLADDWYEATFEDFQTIAGILGVSFTTQKGVLKQVPAIYFSDFSSQSRGLYYVAVYTHNPKAYEGLLEYAPEDYELHRIAKCLEEVQRTLAKGTLRARVEHTGRDSHFNRREVEVFVEEEDGTETFVNSTDRDVVVNALAAFAQWMYRALEKEYDYETSNDCLEKALGVDYEFDARGKII